VSPPRAEHSTPNRPSFARSLGIAAFLALAGLALARSFVGPVAAAEGSATVASPRAAALAPPQADETVALSARAAGAAATARSAIAAPLQGPEPTAASVSSAPVGRASFTLSGTVVPLAGQAVEGPLRVCCTVEADGRPLPGHATGVDAGGAYGPLTVALPGEGAVVRVRLEGGNVAIEERLVTAVPGAHLAVDFRPVVGLDVWFQIVDDGTDGLLPGGEVEVRWDAAGLLTRTFATSGPDGYALARGCPSATIEVAARAEGYSAMRLGPWALPEAAEFTNVIRLRPARRLRGRVVHAGAPLEDFEVTWWPTDNRLDAHARRFRASAGGEFELDDVPLGDVALVASALGYAPGSKVTFAADESAEVVLEVAASVRGRGRVVDGATGAAVADAIVQPYVTELASPVAPWGTPLPVGRDGEFDQVGFAAGRARVRVSAPGYGVRWVETRVEPGETIDFGLVALGARQPLEVRLVFDGELDPAEYWMWAHGDEDLSERVFGEGGVLLFPEVSSGVYHLQVNSVHGLALEHTVVLEPGEDWSIGIPVGGTRELSVEVRSGGSALPEGLVVVAELPAPDGLRSIKQQRTLSADGRASFRGVLPGDFTLRVASADEVLSVRSGSVAPADEALHVALDLEASRTIFRVVDARGAPVAGAWVGAVCADDRTAGAGGVTGADGSCTLIGLEPGLHHAAISHDSLGARYAIPVDVRGVRGEELELLLSAELHVELRLADGEELLAGVHCRLWDALGNNALPPITTDHAGLARWDRLAEGSYVVKISGPDVFDVQATVAARADDLPTPVEVRRTGDVELRVVAPTGLPLRGAALELACADFAEPLAAWLADGRVVASDPAAQTDGGGRLLLEGLPRGAYTGRVGLPGGGSADVELQVVPGTCSRSLVTLP
jgi:hypothetical protein